MYRQVLNNDISCYHGHLANILSNPINLLISKKKNV